MQLASSQRPGSAQATGRLVPARGRPSRLDANARAAAKDRMADQRRAKAEVSNIATMLVQARAPRENTHPACAG